MVENDREVELVAPIKGAQHQEYGVFWGEGLFCNVSPKVPVIEHILYKGDTIFITAQAGVGKSILALQMMASLSSGKPLFGAFKVHRPNYVLYLQTEGDRVETLERMKAMSKGVSFWFDNIIHVNLDGICLNTAEGYNKFVQLIKAPEIMYDVVIIDPLYTTVKGSLSNDDVATDWIRYMRSLRNFYRCSYIVVHHDSIKEQWSDGVKIEKGPKDIMGSTYWGAFVSYNYKLTVNKEGIYTLTSGKTRNRYVIDKVQLKMVEPEPLMYVISDESFNVSENQVERLLEDSKEPLGAKQLIEQTGLSRATIYRILKNLSEKDKISKSGDGNSVKYSFKNNKRVLDKP